MLYRCVKTLSQSVAGCTGVLMFYVIVGLVHTCVNVYLILWLGGVHVC